MFGVVKSTVIDGVEFEDETESIVVSVRPRKGAKQRCGMCQRRCPRYHHGEGRRRWRGPDLGLLRSFLEADAPRVTCGEHGVVVASVPWARHGARHTRVFEDTIAWMATRTYLLKEQLREVFALKGEQGKQLLDRWLSWARRRRIPAFVHLAQRIARHREAIDATPDHRLSNGLVESTNTKIRLLTRMAFGFKSPEAMIALAMLNLGGCCPPLPRPSRRVNRPTEPAGEPFSGRSS